MRWSVGPAQNSFTFTVTPGVLQLVTVRAINGDGVGPFAAELGVSIPRLSAIPDRNDPVGTPVAVAAVALDPDGSVLSFTASNLPPGVAIDGRSGRLTGTPTTSGTYRPTVTVSDGLASDVQSFAWTIVTAGSGSAMTSVAMSFSSVTPQVLGTAIVVSASGQGSSTPMYRYWVQPWGGAWQIVQDWTTSASYTWRPAVVGGYNLTVDGRGRSSGNADVTISSSFEVIAAATGGGAVAPMTSMALAFSLPTPQVVGTAVTIVASGQGGSGTPMYRFWVQPWGGAWQIVQDWSTASSYPWRLPATGGYNVTVYGRNGASGNGDVNTSRTFEATATSGGSTGGTTTAMSSVALSFTPTTPQVVGTAVTLSARGQGGSGTPMYRFLVQPWGGAWQVVQDWSSTASVVWKPAAAGGYNLTVYGRNGTSGAGDVSDSRTFEATASGTVTTGVRSPMTSVTLTYTPKTPQPVGTSLTMTAQGSGGSGTAMYRFWVQPWGGAWQIVQDWSTSPTCAWRPSAGGGYNFTVYGRTGSTGEGDVSASTTFEAR